MRYYSVLMLLIYKGLTLIATEGGNVLPIAGEFTSMLGWTFSQAVEELGDPVNIFSFRGKLPSEDNVVFYYADNRYLFWFQDRVWQIRADERWEGEIDGVRMGMNRVEVEELWGTPINETDEAPTWTLPERGYPVRIRLYFEDEKLVDIYIYRSDW